MFCRVSFTDFTTHSSVPSQSPATTQVPPPTFIPSTSPTSGHMRLFHTHTPSASDIATVKIPSAPDTIPTSPAIPKTNGDIAVPTIATETPTSTADITTSDVTLATSWSSHAAMEILSKTSTVTTSGPVTDNVVHREEPGNGTNIYAPSYTFC